MRPILLFLVILMAPAHAGSLIQPANETCAKQWQQVDPMKRGELEAKLLRYGLSSTGKIKIQNIYRLTHDSLMGKKGDRMAMVIQEDLMGDRLFWVVLINLETKAAQLVYDVQDRKKAESGPGE